MTMTAKFAGTCSTCKARINAGDRIEWTKGVGAKHATPAQCIAAVAAQPVAAAAPAPVIDLKPIVAFLAAAQARGLKFPKARFLAPGGGELRLSIAGPTAQVPGALQVKRDEEWIGRVNPDGTVVGRQLAGDTAVQDTLVAIAADPVTAAKAYGALMCRCSFCDSVLTDEGSVEVGFGPICAKRFGLEHRAKGTPTLKVLAQVPTVAA